MIDYHVHSLLSADCDVEMETMCREAVRAGIRELCFTEHLDLDYPLGDLPFDLDFDDYHRRLEEMKRQFPHLSIKKGIEIGYQRHVLSENLDVLRRHSFDFVLSSVHVVDGLDPYFPSYFEGKSKEFAYRRYLEKVYESVTAFHHYNVIGHLGYVSRGAPYEDPELRYEDFPDEIDAILRELISSHRGLEVNTSGYRHNPFPIPGLSILKRYRELGGEIVTLGSDAHYPEYLAFRFSDAQQLLEEAGFRYLAVFDNMEPRFVKIQDL
ncbi:MAG: histidinol-phosphatase HisJ family protein [Clostridia bacterium]|jgi:histidinol-phosphatase (PHP family)